MATHQTTSHSDSERLDFHANAFFAYATAWICMVVGLVATVILGYFWDGDHSFRRFFFAYLVAWVFFMAITLGGLFFVLIQHVTRAGWSVNVRRVAEWIAACMPMMAALSAPIIISIVLNNGVLYPWAAPAHGHLEMTPFKLVYLNPAFVVARLVFYFILWSWLGVWYLRQSLRQDATGDIELTLSMQRWSAISLVVYALTVTAFSFDVLMSLAPGWVSTIFGVYFFADCVLGIFATLIIVTMILRACGYLRESITAEHYHDLGKFLFAFTFFWGYIAFSQYMLYWYANIPEEVAWYQYHGASTAQPNGWSPVIIALLFGHFIIPFAGLLSRHVKRNAGGLTFWAVWQLAFVYIGMLWIAMPQLDHRFHFNVIEVTALIGVGGAFVMWMLRNASHGALRPLHDPRLDQSLAFHNI